MDYNVMSTEIVEYNDVEVNLYTKFTKDIFI